MYPNESTFIIFLKKKCLNCLSMFHHHVPSHLHTSQASQAQQLQGMCPAEAPPEGTQGGAIDHHVAAKALMGWEVKPQHS